MTQTPAVSSSAPVMRDLFNKQVTRHIGIGIGISIIVGIAFKFLYIEPRKSAYAEFYKNYDADKACERIKSKGHFHST